MFESNFEYNENLINKINACVMKKHNIIVEIAMTIIFLSACVLMATSNIWLGVIFGAIFVILLASLVITNKSISKSNRILIGQEVNVIFNEENMIMTAKLGNKTIYKATFEYRAIKRVAKSKDLVLVYFDNSSAVILPKSSFKITEDYDKAIQYMENNYVV